MGYELYRMIRDGAPAGWTPAMRMVAMVIADDARDPSQGPPGDGGWPRSAIRIRGGYSRDGDWYDGIIERTGKSERAISRALTALARAGYEMREQVGTDRRGRPVFAYPGRTPRFRVPPLKPRESPPSTATFGSPPSTATTGSPPDTATTGSPPSTATMEGSQIWRGRSPDLASKVAASGGLPTPVPNPLPTPSPHPQVVNSSLEGDRDRAADDDDDDQSEFRLPGHGRCSACGEWRALMGGGTIARHRDRRDWSKSCGGSRQPPAEPVSCARCGRTGVALGATTGLCGACRREASEAAEPDEEFPF
jgi:hypothetical protein